MRLGLRQIITGATMIIGIIATSISPSHAAAVGETGLPAQVSTPAPVDGTEVATLWRIITPPCKEGEIRENGCVCPPGQARKNSICTPIDPPILTTEEPIRQVVPQKPHKPHKPKPPKKTQKPPVKVEPAPNGIAVTDMPGNPCMDADLFDLVTKTYGKRKGLASCYAGCVPRPTLSMMPKEDLEKAAKAYETNWCPSSCIKVSGYMPADEVLKLELKTGRKFCPVDGATLCRVEDGGSVPVKTSVDKILAFYPASVYPRENGDKAVIVGVSDYQAPLPILAHARRDAEAVKAVFVDKLGYAAGDVTLQQGATLAQMKAIFGPEGSLAKSKPTGTLVVYIAAHGMSDATGNAYILPSDADPARLSETALPLQALYESLGKLGAKSVTVILEASFPTGLDELIDPPNLPTTEVAVLPASPVAGLSVFTAADRDQQTLADPEYGTGLFTRYLLEGLAGAADSSPIGNADKKIESVELYVFTAHKVRVAARKSFGLEQKPQISEAQTALMRNL